MMNSFADRKRIYVSRNRRYDELTRCQLGLDALYPVQPDYLALLPFSFHWQLRYVPYHFPLMFLWSCVMTRRCGLFGDRCGRRWPV